MEEDLSQLVHGLGERVMGYRGREAPSQDVRGRHTVAQACDQTADVVPLLLDDLHLHDAIEEGLEEARQERSFLRRPEAGDGSGVVVPHPLREIEDALLLHAGEVQALDAPLPKELDPLAERPDGLGVGAARVAFQVLEPGLTSPLRHDEHRDNSPPRRFRPRSEALRTFAGEFSGRYGPV